MTDATAEVERVDKELRAWSGDQALVPSDLEALEYRIDQLDQETAIQFCGTLQQRRQDEALIQGLVLYKMRIKLDDGEWGRWNREFQRQTGMSESTVKNRVRKAVDFFGLELTPRMVVAREAAASEADEDDGGVDWDDDEAYAGFGDEDGPADPGLEGMQRHQLLVGEPWAERDSVSPSPRYENPPDSPPEARRPAVPPDDTWMAFTAGQIEAEHPALAGETARRNARARWDRKIREEPLELLEELEMIYEAEGRGAVPDEIGQALLEAEENKAIKPDSVEQPKKRRSAPKTVPELAQRLMENARELHQKIVVGAREGDVTDADLAEAHAAVSGLCAAAESLRKKTGPASEKAKAEARRAKADAADEALSEVPGYSR